MTVEYAQVVSLILGAIVKGRTQVRVYRTLSSATLGELRETGHMIESAPGIGYIISWRISYVWMG